VSIGVAAYGCLDLPVGATIRSPSGHGAVPVGEGTTVVRVDHAEAVGQSAVSVADAAAFDKLVRKGKLARIPLIE
jgi:hypothetical protein